MAIASSLVQSCTSRLAGNLTTAAREMLPSGASIAALKAEAKGWYDTEPTSLKTDLVASFDGAASNIEWLSGGAVAETLPGEFTISFWVRPTASSLASSYLIDLIGPGTGYFRVILDGPVGRIRFLMRGNGDPGGTMGYHQLTLDAWTNITVVRDSADDVRCYANDVELFAPASFPSDIWGASMTIGRDVFMGLDAQMAHAAIWDTALSGANITALYNSGTPSVAAFEALSTNGVSLWPLNEPRGMRYDRWGTNHLTDNNTVGTAHGPVEYQADNYAGITRWDNQGTAASPFGNLTPITAGESPQLITGELVWDGLAKALLTPTGSVSQPLTKFLVITPSSFGGNDYLSSSYTAKNILRLLSTSLNMFSGASFSGAPNLVAATRYIIVAIFDGTSSRLIISGTETTGNAGTANGTGLAVGSSDGGAAPYRGGIEADLEFDRILTGSEIAALTAAYS